MAGWFQMNRVYTLRKISPIIEKQNSFSLPNPPTFKWSHPIHQLYCTTQSQNRYCLHIIEWVFNLLNIPMKITCSACIISNFYYNLAYVWNIVWFEIFDFLLFLALHAHCICIPSPPIESSISTHLECFSNIFKYMKMSENHTKSFVCE